MSVPENRTTGSGRTIDLRVVVVGSRGSEHAADPIFWLAGGPGGGAAEDAPAAVQFLQWANLRRDLVFVDQRGTGGSNNLECPQGTDSARWADELRDCLGALSADPRAYTTAWAMDDLDDVRSALGYETVNLYGGSYGATAAQVYLQRHPTRVRTATLMGGSLLDVPLFERFPVNSQRALDLLFAACATDPGCHKAFPDPAGDLRAVAERLDRGSVDLPVTNPATGRPVRAERRDLGPAVHSLLVNAQTAALLPAVLHAAAEGDWSPIADLVTRSTQPAEPSWLVMNLTIMCHEPWARVRPTQTAIASTRSYLDYADVQALTVPKDVCAVVPRPPEPALYAPLVVVNAPVLFINGDADPQDPPANVVLATATYPDSIALTAPGEAHQFAGVACLADIVSTFIERASTQALPAGCLIPGPAQTFDLG
jgi:pimeloyl-ACP methyl ester carboxylesterase